MALLRRRQEAVTAKPAVSELGIDLAAQVWRRSGRGDGTIEVAFARSAPAGSSPEASSGSPQWVLMRVAGDPDRRVLVLTGTSGSASLTVRAAVSSTRCSSPWVRCC